MLNKLFEAVENGAKLKWQSDKDCKTGITPLIEQKPPRKTATDNDRGGE